MAVCLCHDYPSQWENINGATLPVSQLEQGGVRHHWSSSFSIISMVLYQAGWQKKAQQQQIGHEKVKTTLQYPMRSKVCDVYKLVISQLKTNLYLIGHYNVVFTFSCSFCCCCAFFVCLWLVNNFIDVVILGRMTWSTGFPSPTPSVRMRSNPVSPRTRPRPKSGPFSIFQISLPKGI